MNKLKQLKFKIDKKIIYYLTYLISHLPKKKIIYFESFHGKSFNDNPRAIYEQFANYKDGYQLIWGVKKGYESIFSDYPEVNYVPRFSWKWFWVIGRARVWVTNTRTPAHFFKGKNTTYLETWHGTPLKKLGLDIKEVTMPGTDTETYMRNFVRESTRWDFLIAPNHYSSKIFRQAFGFEGEILETGYPRNDVLVTQRHNLEYMAEIKRKLGIASADKVILYAPTWRDNEFYSKGNYKFTFPFNLEKALNQLGENVVILVRMHYLVSDRFDFSEYHNRVIDASNYDEMSHLLLISDALITDYSSSFFDYAILKRPMIFYMYDLEEYEQDIRGMYLNIYKELPGPIVETEEDLMGALKDVVSSDFNVQSRDKETYQCFNQKYTSLETGNASQKVIERLTLEERI
ncbi:CDP-glycerol glycerophosphotransferase family protein [Vagococcus lutrae]|uniref:CDP-glycerol glycerophosphotransferase family protein n=1 Tax=Vagococcus lutrae TaxID=81947 RepID=UPI0028909864|nr:CDP-glycerol glycerophosphotransferase family protein [Vagococcus lutrae]MDT2807395.1 CDP-glycerol glycerophosphotransferase family protein [Vagococcus lutrae]